MFSPSDYNDAVPQFTNGTYANTPLNPLYVEEPTALDYNRGVEPVQTLPAQWWNWLCGQFTSKLNKLNIYVKNIFDELSNLLSLVGLSPSGTEQQITTEQLKGMFQTNYPAYLTQVLAGDFVKTINGYPPNEQGERSVILGSHVPITKTIFNALFSRFIGASLKEAQGLPPSTTNPVVNSIANDIQKRGDMWVLASSLGVYWSEDGINWTQATGGVANYNALKILYNDDIWVAVMGRKSSLPDTMVWWSEDGKNWTRGTGITSNWYLYNTNYVCTCKNGIFYIVPWSDASTTQGLWYSTDGKTWAKAQLTASVTVTSVTNLLYENGIFVCNSYNGGVFWSTDGINWTRADIGSNSFYGLCYGNGMWVCWAGTNKRIWWSEDGMNWSTGTASENITQVGCISYANGMWVTYASNSMWYSIDGKDWKKGTGKTTGSVGMFYNRENKWIAYCDNGIMYSVDGKHWFSCVVESTDFASSNLESQKMLFDYKNGVWICGKSDTSNSTPFVYKSLDGIFWTPIVHTDFHVTFAKFKNESLYIGTTASVSGINCPLFYSRVEDAVADGCIDIGNETPIV